MVDKELLDEFRLAVAKIFEGAVEWKDVDPEEALPLAQSVVLDARTLLLKEDRESALAAELDHSAYDSLRDVRDKATRSRLSSEEHKT